MGVGGVIVIALVAAALGFAGCALLSRARCNDCARIGSMTVEPAWERGIRIGTEHLDLRPGGMNHLEINQASHDVLNERTRQIAREGWTAEHDDAWTDGQLAIAAACYAIGAERVHIPRIVGRGTYFHFPTWSEPKREQISWPWAPSWWKPKDHRRDLVRAGALILAEIERLDRAAARAQAGDVQGVPS